MKGIGAYEKTYIIFGFRVIFIIFCITETYFQLFIKFRAFLRPCTKNGATVSHGKKPLNHYRTSDVTYTNPHETDRTDIMASDTVSLLTVHTIIAAAIQYNCVTDGKWFQR